MTTLNLKWVTCGNDGHWCNLQNLTLDFNTSGVYVIWKPGNPGSVIRVGQGDIADRLQAHRTDRQITRHGHDLLVTWASVHSDYRDGVERFLAEQYNPIEGDRFPDVPAISVNLVGK